MRILATALLAFVSTTSLALAGTGESPMTPLALIHLNKAMSDTALNWPILFDDRAIAHQWPVVFQRNPNPGTNMTLSAKTVQIMRAKMSCLSPTWTDLGPCKIETPFIVTNPDYFKLSTDTDKTIAVKQ